LVTRLITTCWSSWPRPSTGGAASSRRCRNSTFSARSTRWRISATSCTRSMICTGVAIRAARRRSRSRLRPIRVARSTSRVIVAAVVVVSGSLLVRPRNSASIRIAASGLLTSWATPLAISPTVASFSRAISSRWARSSSVRSYNATSRLSGPTSDNPVIVQIHQPEGRYVFNAGLHVPHYADRSHGAARSLERGDHRGPRRARWGNGGTAVRLPQDVRCEHRLSCPNHPAGGTLVDANLGAVELRAPSGRRGHPEGVV